MAVPCIAVGGILLLLTNMQVRPTWHPTLASLPIPETCRWVGRWGTCLLPIAPPSSPSTTAPSILLLRCFSSSRCRCCLPPRPRLVATKPMGFVCCLPGSLRMRNPSTHVLPFHVLVQRHPPAEDLLPDAQRTHSLRSPGGLQLRVRPEQTSRGSRCLLASHRGFSLRTG